MPNGTNRLLKKVFMAGRRNLQVAFMNRLRNLKITATVSSCVFQQLAQSLEVF